MSKLFVPESLRVPDSLDTDHFHLEVLTPAVAEMDYEAVMSSRVRLRSVFDEETNWPDDTMSLSDNIKDLKRHHDEFLSRKAFAYTVLTPTKDKCIGCVYIDPCEVDEFDCEVFLWVTDDCLNLDNELYQNIRDWLTKCWPFKKIAFPGRDITWEKWKSRGN
jgi:hypothetical protein